MDDSVTLKNIENRLSALIALTALSFSDPKVKLEVVLSRAGLSNAEISKMLGKNMDAVKKVLQRAKK